jgi:hypothetical protein
MQKQGQNKRSKLGFPLLFLSSCLQVLPMQNYDPTTTATFLCRDQHFTAASSPSSSPLKLSSHPSQKRTTDSGSNFLSLCKEDQNICLFCFFLSNYFHIIHQKTPTKKNNDDFFMQRRSKHLLLLLLFPPPPPPLTLSSHPSQNNTNKCSNSNFGFQKIQNLPFSSFSLQQSSHSQKSTNNNGNGNFFMQKRSKLIFSLHYLHILHT